MAIAGRDGWRKPTITFDMRDLPDLRAELDKLNVRTKDQGMIAGKLEATSYHLEDLRALLKLKN